MKKKLLCLALLLAVLTSLFLPVQSVTATTYIATFYCTTSDGSNSLSLIQDTSYATARDAAAGEMVDDPGDMLYSGVAGVGQSYYVAMNAYAVQRAWVFFSTASIPNDATIDSVTLRLFGSSEIAHYGSNTWVVQEGMSTYPHDPLIGTDFNRTNYNAPILASKTGWNTNTWNSFSLYSSALSEINKTGTTKFVIRSNDDVTNTTPTQFNEFVSFYQADYGNAAQLVVEYTVVDAPTVTTQAASNVAQSSAILRGTLTDLGDDTYADVRFNYGTSPSNLATSTSWVTRTSTGSFNVSIGSLAASTTYYFQSEAQNSGTPHGYGSILSFTTTAAIAAPTVTTYGADSELETQVRLIGYLSNDGGQSSSVRFEYGLTGGYGSYTSWQSGFVSGNYFYATITGLNRGDLYYFRAVGTNSAGTGNGAQDTVITYPAAPYSFTASPSAAQNALAWTKGNGAQKTMVRWSTVTYPLNIADGTQCYFDTGASYDHTSLDNGTTYYYTAWSYATEGGEEKYSYNSVATYGQPYALTTATVQTLAATAVGTTGATLHGRLISLGGYGTTDVSFQWYKSGGSWTDHETTPVTKSASCDFSADISGLDADSTYYFRVKATNGAGTIYGDGQSFVTGGYSAPTMTTNAATDITKTEARLSGTVTSDGGITVTAWFEWGETTSYGDTSTTVSGLSTGSTIYLNLDNLTPGTTYHYRVVGQNSAGIAYGSDVSFTTSSPDLPTVTTLAATEVGSNSAILRGLLETDGGMACEVQFQWYEEGGDWTDNSTGWQTDKSSGDTFQAPISGLTVGRTYYFRAQVKNDTGTASGATQYFSTVFTAPTNFDATALTSAAIRLTWTKQGDQTYIVASSIGYSGNRTLGTKIYFGTGSVITYSSLDPGVTYYFSAWSWAGNDTWSSTYATALATTPASPIGGTSGERPEVVDTPSKPSSWWAAPDHTRMANMPLYAQMNDYADSLSMPEGTFWMLSTLLLAMLIGTIAFILIHSANAGIAMMCIVILAGGFLGLLPLWMMATISIFAIGAVFLKQRGAVA